MATVSTTGLYPEDLHGTNPLNLIPDEIQTLSVPGKDDYYFIIPHAAPFFVDSLEVYNAQTGEKYNENDDYLVGHWFIEAMDSIGRPIAGSIRFMKRTIVGQVKLKYRTIGGNWGFSETQILAELNRRLLNPLVRSWGMIGELPYSFPPLEHDQSIDSLVGSAEIEAALRHLADVVEASAIGASEQHLKDYNNPHKVTKAQVLLGLVQNYGMATNPEAIAGVRTDAYVSPASMLAAISSQALTPLNAHIRATGNVHDMVPADINLGNVPNYPAATPSQAIDVTNNASLMTPYTSALLIQRLLNTARIDDLEDKINRHIADTTSNPHGITPDMIGTYTKERIDELIEEATGGSGDAATFGGKTPGEWEAAFLSTEEFDKFISDEQFGGAIADAANDIGDPTVAPEPQTDEDIENYNASKISGVRAGYEAYVVNSSTWAGRMVASSDVPMGSQTGAAFPEYFADSQNQWASQLGARYSISARGAILCTGPNVVQAPAKINENTASPTLIATDIWANKTEIFAVIGDGRMIRWNAANQETVVGTYTAWRPNATGRAPVKVHFNNQYTYPLTLSIVEYEVTTGASEAAQVKVPAFTGVGVTSWVNSVKTVVDAVTAIDLISGVSFIDDYVTFVTETKGAFIARINRTNAAAPVLALDATVEVFDGAGNRKNHRDASLIDNSDDGEGIASVDGSYKHTAMFTNRGKVWFLGDNSEGQCDVLIQGQKIIGIAAGYNFTVTVNSVNQTQFFGDSPDNSLLYADRGIIVDPTDTSDRRYE